MHKLLALTIGNEGITPPPGVMTGGQDTFNKILSTGITLTVWVSILLSFLFIIWGGFQWITSGGDPKGVDAARQKIIYAIMGLVLVFLSFLIVNLLSHFFGINLLPVPEPGCGTSRLRIPC